MTSKNIPAPQTFKAPPTYPKWVIHDDMVWRVVFADQEEGETQYHLTRGIGKRGRQLWAWASDCKPYTPEKRPPVRKLRCDDVVLEFNARGQVFLRRKKSSKRYPTTLRALYDATVKQAVAAAKFAKRRKK